MDAVRNGKKGSSKSRDRSWRAAFFGAGGVGGGSLCVGTGAFAFCFFCDLLLGVAGADG